ncbi:MAG: TetR/AcrR family transcriptional regulator [Pseudomonadota bacterium]
MHKLEKRTEILRAALELIAEHGFHAAPMAIIANRAEVGAGTIYRYFANKDVLIIELYREIEEKIMPCLLKGYAEKQPIPERFLHLSTALLRYFISNPQHFRYLEQFFNSPYGVELRREKLLGRAENRDAYHELFVEGVVRKVIKDLPLPLLYSLSFGPLLAVTRDHVLGFIVLDDALILKFIEACWDGLKA